MNNAGVLKLFNTPTNKFSFFKHKLDFNFRTCFDNCKKLKIHKSLIVNIWKKNLHDKIWSLFAMI